MGSQEVDRSSGRCWRRERNLWIAAAGWLLLIYSTLYYVRGPIELLRERNLLRLTVAAAFLLAAVTVTLFLLRQRPGWRGVAVLGSFATVYLVVLLGVERPEEKLHFIEYGVLGALIYAALLARRERLDGGGSGSLSETLRWGFGAVLLTSALGWGDEGLQAILPNRFYDLRDVALNAIAAVLAVSAAIAWQRALARDHQLRGRREAPTAGE